MEEVTTVTMNDIMNDRDMKKSDGLDGQVSLDYIVDFNPIFIVYENIRISMVHCFILIRFGDQRTKTQQDFSQRQLDLKLLPHCTKNVILFPMSALCR